MLNPSEPPLRQQLRHHAAQRGLWADTTLSPEHMFALVRDMPYARPSQPDPETVIQEWRGTCSTKHSLLQALFAEVGLPSTVMACTQEIHLPAGLPVPPELQALLDSGPIYDVHNYLVVHSAQGETVVDATWPLHLKAIGLPANEHLIWGQAMEVACQPLETWAVPAGQRVEEHKAELLERTLTANQREQREAFITTVSRLLSATGRR
ncbi:hypothetical protein ACFFLM_02325 [Deinococcus oregonensis]|uniref:Transglutaminase-like domain-containing protein n=1 Tax=Deinococcus oregonensis TaxID=1805970 RepID=A0ABV6ATJ9_9DEIO